MSLVPGTRLGPYNILAPIGAGGMGEVYRASDARLDREVAIKVLPPSMAQDRERLARFEREAKVLASLNHPHIAQIYGLEESDGTRALVMELVPGSTLAVPQPLDTALQYALQIADALEAAHEKGITHRDLKPANIMITASGVVKVLDFGLASVPGNETAADPANSPTITMATTQAGVIMGTAAYMSPEQASGKPVDKRSDIWSFGVVLFEMLTGSSMFTGETVSHTLAHVLTAPIDFQRLPASTPRPIVDLLHRCLDRDPRRRLRDIGEARLAIERYLADPGATAPASLPMKGRAAAGWVVAAILALALASLSFFHFRPKTQDAAPARFVLPAPPNSRLPVGGNEAPSRPALSPDGHKLVFRAVSTGNRSQLWLRSLDSLDPRPIPGTEDGYHPFWSPDSNSIAFSADGKLKRIDLAGGVPLSLADIGSGTGFSGSWGAEGIILFSRASNGPLFQVPATGGAVSPASTLDAKRESRHVAMSFLPGGNKFLFVALEAGTNSGTVHVGSLGSLQSQVLPGVVDSMAIFAAGYLLFDRNGILFAQSFDTGSLRYTGDAVPIVENVALRNFTAAAGRTLVFIPRISQLQAALVWFDRQGKQLGTLGSPKSYTNPSLSPDGRRLAVSIGESPSRDVWVFDLSRGVSSRLPSNPRTT